MINHILVPLDGSSLAECVLPHVMAVSQGTEAHITLMHILEMRHPRDQQAVDPLEWHLRKQEAEEYLNLLASRLKSPSATVQKVILEGSPAEVIIDFANHHAVDLIALSSHGKSGLSGWNISSVVQKIVLRSCKSILLIRAYESPAQNLAKARYERLFVGLDFSPRAEYVLPLAGSLAQFHRAELVIGMVLGKPEILHRFPLTDDELELATRIGDSNHRAASHYFEQLQSRLSVQGINLQTRLVVSENVTAALHDMVEAEKPDLVLLSAHGRTGESRWPYGSVAASFIAHGTTSLLIVQDLTTNEIGRTRAELAALEIRGH